MSPRGSQRSSEGRKQSERQTSVVGSTISDVSSRLRGRGLPRGGIRGRDSLKVAEGALADTTTIGSTDGTGRMRSILRIVAIVSGSLAAFLVVLALVLMALSHTDLFSITTIETYDSDHISADVVARLADLHGGETLLNVDVASIENNVKKNPWVSSVTVTRVYPNTLRIQVRERSLGSFVAMSSGGIAWLMGSDGVWIEPTRIESGDDESTNDAALAEADRLGVILISDVPATVMPVAGTLSTDASIQAVQVFRDELSAAFREQVVSYSAASEDDVSCILKNGVEVSFGSATNIATKESVAKRILDEYGGQVTYINVRTPSHPTYRRVNSEFVREGTGATGTSVEEESKFTVTTAPEDEKKDDEDASGGADSLKTDDAQTGETDEFGNQGTAATNGYSDYEDSSQYEDYGTSDYSYGSGYTENDTYGY